MTRDSETTLSILAVDDTRSNLLLLKALLGEEGHAVFTAADGVQAIEAFEREQPDVVLMDVMMPAMDGIEAATRIRERNRVVPIVFLSADTDAHSIERALKIGTDYITKPIQTQQLLDKLNAHFRSVLANRELLRQKREIEDLHDRLVEENRVAAEVLSRMLSRMEPPSELIRHSVIPTGMFSGDLVLAGTTPSGRLHVMLADAIGHGLPAAFTLLPIIPAFHAMTTKGFPLQDILFEINRTLRTTMPIGRFVAATAVSLDPADGQAEFWVGGTPTALIRDAAGLQRLPSRHLALGLNDFDDKSAFAGERRRLARDDRIVFFSDGLSETWQEGDLEDFILGCPPDAVFERVQAAAKRLHGHDDSSLVVVRVPEQAVEAAAPEAPDEDAAAAAAAGPGPRVSFDLDCRQLRDPEIMHTMTDAATRLGIVEVGDGMFHLVFSELFMNALDHGVLHLSSELRYAGPSGFDAYFQQREMRLAALRQGRIAVHIEATEFAGAPSTLLRIVDSGPGFDQSKLRADVEVPGEAAAGRGIKLLINICHKVAYAGNGNDVTVYIPRDGRASPRTAPSLPPYYASNI